MKLFQLSVELDMDSADFEAKLKAANKQINEFKKAVKESQEPIDQTQKKIKSLKETIEKLKDKNNDLSAALKSIKQDFADFKKAAKEAASGAETLKQSEENTTTATNKFVTDFKSAFSFSLGLTVANALKEGLSALKGFAEESIALASDLVEVQNVVDVTFGDSATAINNWSKTALSAFGMSELKAKNYSSTMGAMLKSMGLADDEVLTMAESLTELTGDMASFYNMDHEEIFAKIRSGISGETEPLRQLGINMSVANLQAYALSQGIDKTYSSMTQAEQATLRYNYLLSATADAQGDYARTSDSYANAITTLTEHFNTLKAALGEELIDVITPAINMVNGLFESDQYQDAMDATKSTQNDEEAAAYASYEQASYLIGKLESGELTEGTEDWEDALKALVKVMPELGNYIDTNTGKLTTSTAELRKNAEAVRDLAIYDAKQNAIESYNQIASDASQARADKQVELWVSQAKASSWRNRYESEFAKIKEATGLDDESVSRLATTADLSILDEAGITNLSLDALEYFSTLYDTLVLAEAEVAGLEDDIDDLTEAEKQAAEEAERAALALEYAGLTYEEALAARDYEEAMDAQLSALTAIESKATELQNAYAELKTSALESVQSLVSGFAVLDLSSVTQILGGKNAEDSLENRLKNETAYMREYANNLNLVMSSAFSGTDGELLNEGLVAQLADGSEESAAILRGLTQATGEERATMVDELNATWEANQEAMDTMAEAMATAEGRVDETVEGLVSELEALIEAANQDEELRQQMRDNMDAITDGVLEKEDSVRAAVNSVNNILSSIGKVNFSLLTGGGETETAASNAKGLDYVPYNDYLTYLHKGETVLSRTEAERYRAGQSSRATAIDYDALAAAMAGVMDGAVVQMDGQTVGQLVAPSVSRAIQQEARAGRFAT